MHRPFDAMTRACDIIAFGDTCVDLILRDADIAPRFGQVEKVIAEYRLLMGGSCCIFAAGAAKLGLRVGLLGKLGDDAFGKLIRQTLENAGVDARHLQTDPQLQTGLTAHLTQADDRAMLTVPGTATALTPADVTDDFLASARHLHLGSLFLQTGLLPDWIKIARRAKALGLTVSLDTNWDPSEKWDFGLERALPLIDVLLPNEQEALQLTGAQTWEAAADILHPHVDALVIKRGDKGAVAWQKGQFATQEAYPVAAGGDGIGAGDSFDAGFLTGWLSDLPLGACLDIACQCGAAAASAIGGEAGQLRRADLPALSA